MDAARVISLLKSYKSIGNEELVEIKALKKQFPWFATLHQLEAKCLKNENKFGLKKSIKTASLFAGDREVLYDFMHDTVDLNDASTQIERKPFKENQVEIKPIETRTNVEVKTAKVEKPITEGKKVPDAPVVEKTKVDPDEKPAIEKLQTPSKEVPIKKLVTETVIHYDPLVALQSKIIKPEEESKAKKTGSKVYDPLVELPKLEKESRPKKKTKQDFFSWLDSLEDDEPKVEPKPRKLKMSAEASELLEKFIKNRPSISRIRTDIERTEVHKTTTQNTGNELVTESLANLHLKQGRPEKAIEVYEKLGLQNPEKFSYFAALIEKAKQEHNIE